MITAALQIIAPFVIRGMKFLGFTDDQITKFTERLSKYLTTDASGAGSLPSESDQASEAELKKRIEDGNQTGK